MAKSCAEGGTQHVGGDSESGPTYQVIVGPELVTYQPMVCNTCGAPTRNVIISRERNTN